MIGQQQGMQNSFNWGLKKFEIHISNTLGVHSWHHNGAEDRRFKFKCCRTRKSCARDCRWTGYVNYWDAYMSYAVPSGYFITGVKSFHDNGRE
jgi:lipoyltransferase 1